MLRGIQICCSHRVQTNCELKKQEIKQKNGVVVIGKGKKSSRYATKKIYPCKKKIDTATPGSPRQVRLILFHLLNVRKQAI